MGKMRVTAEQLTQPIANPDHSSPGGSESRGSDVLAYVMVYDAAQNLITIDLLQTCGKRGAIQSTYEICTGNDGLTTQHGFGEVFRLAHLGDDVKEVGS